MEQRVIFFLHARGYKEKRKLGKLNYFWPHTDSTYKNSRCVFWENTRRVLFFSFRNKESGKEISI